MAEQHHFLSESGSFPVRYLCLDKLPAEPVSSAPSDRVTSAVYRAELPVCLNLNPDPAVVLHQQLSLCSGSGFTDLQREDEDEEEQRSDPDGPSLPPSSSFSPDPSHPFYDVARHGILQVSGQTSSEVPSQKGPERS